jgi:hypothetical protein
MGIEYRIVERTKRLTPEHMSSLFSRVLTRSDLINHNASEMFKCGPFVMCLCFDINSEEFEACSRFLRTLPLPLPSSHPP